MVSPTLTPGKKAGIGYSVRKSQPYLQEPSLRTQQEARIMPYRVTYNDLTIVINSARTSQAACRLAFRYWISNNYISRQPKTNPNWPSTFEGVTVECLKGSDAS